MTGTQCCNCGQPVENETAGTIAPACTDCRSRWLSAEITRAVRTLEANGYTITSPKTKEGTA